MDQRQRPAYRRLSQPGRHKFHPNHIGRRYLDERSVRPRFLYIILRLSRLALSPPDPMPIGGLGGFVGVSRLQEKGEDHAWLAGTWRYWARPEFGWRDSDWDRFDTTYTGPVSYTSTELNDTGAWREYQIEFTINDNFYLMLEDLYLQNDSPREHGVPGDAYFDNVVLTWTGNGVYPGSLGVSEIENPLPGAAWLFFSGLPVLYAIKRRLRT